MNGIVFLDRDGVLNRCRFAADGTPLPPRDLSELELLPGVERACALLSRHGYRLVVVTNQPDVARGTQSRELVEAINARVASALDLDDVRVCWHDDGDGCDCRKPQPGLLQQAAAEAGVDLGRCVMVGDRWRDVEAGKRAGCWTALVGNGHGERFNSSPDYQAENLLDVAHWITSVICTVGRKGMTRQGVGVKLFADGADRAGMLEMYAHPHVSGFTTNPTLMRKAGVTDYLGFARGILNLIPDKPISFEVFSDDFDAMAREAHVLAALGNNVYVKVPVSNTRGEFSGGLVRRLVRDGVKVNVTALMSVDQVRAIAECLDDTPSYVSVFAGRIADTGRDPVPLMAEALEMLRPLPSAELIWASPRELLNVVQASEIGCHVITATNDIIKKLPLLGKDLLEFSLETVRMFHDDARAAGFELGEKAALQA